MLKKKPPLPVFSNGVSSSFNGAVSADELEKIANVLTLHADVHHSNGKTNRKSLETLRRNGGSQLTAKEVSSSSPSVSGLKHPKTPQEMATSKGIDIKGSSPVTPSQSRVSNSTTSSVSQPTNSSNPCKIEKEGPGLSASTKTSTSERYVIDLCMSSDESADDKEEKSALEVEFEDNASKTPLCSPILSDHKDLPTLDPSSPTSPVKESSETIEVLGVVGMVLPYPDEDPKSYSDYAKTPPIEPCNTSAITPPSTTPTKEWHTPTRPSPEENSSNVNCSTLEACSSPHFPFEADPEPGGSSHILPPPPDEEDESIRSPSMLPDPDLQILPRMDPPTPLEEPSTELKDNKPETGVLEAMVDAGPSLPGPRKRKPPPETEEERSRNPKRAKVSRDGKQHDSRLIVVDCVKKCIQEVNSKLDRSRFKVLCRRVSKRLLGAWSIRKPARQRNIERWLKHRHVKIVRLVEKYLEQNLV